MVQNTMRASFGSFSGGRSTMAEYSARSLGIMGRDMTLSFERNPDVVHSPFAGTYRSFRRLRQQRLAGPNAAEHHRLGRDLEAVFLGAHHGVARVLELGGFRKVLAVMRAAAVGARLRGGADRAADQHQ